MNSLYILDVFAEEKYTGNQLAVVGPEVEQGCEIGRPSLLFLKAFIEKGRIEVYVSGRVIEVARGGWFNNGVWKQEGIVFERYYFV